MFRECEGAFVILRLHRMIEIFELVVIASLGSCIYQATALINEVEMNQGVMLGQVPLTDATLVLRPHSGGNIS